VGLFLGEFFRKLHQSHSQVCHLCYVGGSRREDDGEKPEDQHCHFHDNIAEITYEQEHEHPETGLYTHIHSHTKGAVLSLRKTASCAFVLGFGHEEEFALLALAVGGFSPLLLMTAYGLSVTVSLTATTVVGAKMYERVRATVYRYEKYIPKVSGVILLVLAVSILLT
jgi:nickel/cobalt exporter